MTQTQTKTEKQAPVKKAPAKTAPKDAPKRQVKAGKAKAAPQPRVNTHVEAGLNVKRYDGPSSFINGNRRVKVRLGVTRDKLSDRSAQGLYALRDCYGQKAFEPRGFDNGILRNLLAMGLISAEGGSKQVIDGQPHLVDGATPVKFKITSAGMGYGKA